MSPGRALVPYGCACTPAVDNACTTPRTMTTGPASVCGISGPHAVQDDEKSREKKRSHWLAPPIVPHRECPIPGTVPKFRLPREIRSFVHSTIYGRCLHHAHRCSERRFVTASYNSHFTDNILRVGVNSDRAMLSSQSTELVFFGSSAHRFKEAGCALCLLDRGGAFRDQRSDARRSAQRLRSL